MRQPALDADRFAQGIVLLLLAISVAIADSVADQTVGIHTLAALGTILLAVALRALWRQRTQPTNHIGWWLIGLPLLIGLGATGYVGAAAALAASLYVVHDLRLGPSVLMAAGLATSLIQFGFNWTQAGDEEAMRVAMAVLAATLAAIVERDRLAARADEPVAWAWTAVRASILGIWTVLVVQFREDLQAGRIFAALGADVTGTEGRVFLVGVLLAALVLAALLFRSRRAKDEATTPA